jgi:hypothetical protein
VLFWRLLFPDEPEDVCPPILLEFSFSLVLSGFFVVGITKKFKRLTFWLIAYTHVKTMPWLDPINIKFIFNLNNYAIVNYESGLLFLKKWRGFYVL